MLKGEEAVNVTLEGIISYITTSTQFFGSVVCCAAMKRLPGFATFVIPAVINAALIKA